MTTYNLNVVQPPHNRCKLHEFIATVDDVLTRESCNRIIEKFDQHNGFFEQYDNGHGVTVRSNNSVDLSQLPDSNFLIERVNEALSVGISEYAELFEYVNVSGLFSSRIKLQRTPPGGGYHLWHCENSSYHFSQRYLTWMIYLNDIEEGGETEWLYQSLRVKPKAGTIALWPTSYTHLHRGNPPLKETKYIATGWFELFP